MNRALEGSILKLDGQRTFFLTFLSKVVVRSGGWGVGGGKRRGLGPRNDVLTTCKAVTLRGGQRIIALFPTVIIFRLFRSKK